MELDELKDEEMYCLVAPDGSPQIMTLNFGFSECCAMVEVMASHKICEPLAVLFERGFTIIPVKVTVLQNGTVEEGFQKAKAKLKK